MTAIGHNPDVLDALANLSNDEVFTPPKLVNQMLDLLPEQIWSDPTITILDPCSKSGVFLREAAKRFIVGLETQIPDLQSRLNHIFTKQLFGLTITELTGLLSRRSLYCSKYASQQYSLCTDFHDDNGNIWFDRTEHDRRNGSCIYCGASQEQYDRDETLETHAYKFIHTDSADIPYLFSQDASMKFDVIIGNPPYQLNDGGGAGSSAVPLYHFFVEQAKKLQPRYLSMIIPSRWFTGGKGLDEFRKSMIDDTSIRELHDFYDAKECFPGVEIKGGVCYFLRERDYDGLCKVVSHENDAIVSQVDRILNYNNSNNMIRYNESISILDKIQIMQDESFGEIVSPRNPFNIPSSFKGKNGTDNIDVFLLNGNKVKIGREYIEKNKNFIDQWKVIIPKAFGSGNISTDTIKSQISYPDSVCSETYLMVGPFKSKEECENVISYVNTRFFHFLIGLKKITQNSTQSTYSFVPMQDFSKSRTDEELFAKYNLTQDEIDFIVSITPVSL